MNHETLKNDVSAYLDDELTPAAKARVEAHLVSCEECREFVTRFREWGRALAGSRPEVSSEVFVRGVMERIHSLGEVRRRPAFIIPAQWLAPVIGAAAMILLSLVPSTESFTFESYLTGGKVSYSTDALFLNSSTGPNDIVGYLMEES